MTTPFFGKIGRSAVFSPDGKYVYSPIGNVVRSYSVVTGHAIAQFVGHTGLVSGVAFHPTIAKQLVTSSLDGTLRIWDADDGTLLHTIVLNTPLVRLCSVPLPSGAVPKVYLVSTISMPKVSGDIEKKIGSAAAPSSKNPTGSVKKSKRSRSDTKEADDDEIDEKELASASSSVAFQMQAASTYPLGDEAACVQVRPPSYALANTINPFGARRVPTISRIWEFDLSMCLMADVDISSYMRLIHQRRGFVTSLSATVYHDEPSFADNSVNPFSAGLTRSIIPNIAVLYTVRDSIYIFRRSSSGNEGLYVYNTPSLLSSSAIHPLENYVSVSTQTGKITTVIFDELSPSHIPSTPPSSKKHSTPLSPTSIASGVDGALTTSVHWHAHAAWALSFVPDGFTLLSGGEEATLVLWSLSSRLSGASVGPEKRKKRMNFLPRLGAPVRNIASFSASAQTSAKLAYSDALNSANSSNTISSDSNAVPIAFAITLADNSLVLVNGSTLRPIWRVSSLAVAGLPASVTVGMALHARKGVLRERELLMNALNGVNSSSKIARTALGGISVEQLDSEALAFERDRLGQPPSLMLGVTVPPHLLLAASRTLARPIFCQRTKSLVINGFPGKCTLQFLSPALMASLVPDLEVESVNYISRGDRLVVVPPSVRHVAISSDNVHMVTVEETVGGAVLSADSDNRTVLKFWKYSTSSAKSQTPSNPWHLVGRVDNPHKSSITCIRFHPYLPMLITGSSDRTFKVWKLETRDILVTNTSTAASSGSQTASVNSGGSNVVTAELNPNSAATPLTPAVSTVEGAVWMCNSVGFFRDLPVSAVDYSSDGSIVAVAYGSSVGLWNVTTNTLLKTLSHPLNQAGEDASAFSASEKTNVVNNVFFIPNTPYLVSNTSSSAVVWNLLTLSPVWVLVAPIIDIVRDTTVSNLPSRFAVISISPSLVAREKSIDEAYLLVASESGKGLSMKALPPKLKEMYLSFEPSAVLSIFDPATPVPVAIWPLNSPVHTHSGYSSSQYGELGRLVDETLKSDGISYPGILPSKDDVAPVEVFSGDYRACFVPHHLLPHDSRKAKEHGGGIPASVGSKSVNPAGVVVVGPLGEIFSFPLPPTGESTAALNPKDNVEVITTSATASNTPSKKSGVVVVTKAMTGGGLALLQSSITGSSNNKNDISPLHAMSSLNGINAESGDGVGGFSLATLLQSIVSNGALSSPDYVFESMIPVLLPPLQVTATSPDATTARASSLISEDEKSVKELVNENPNIFTTGVSSSLTEALNASGESVDFKDVASRVFGAPSDISSFFATAEVSTTVNSTTPLKSKKSVSKK